MTERYLVNALRSLELALINENIDTRKLVVSLPLDEYLAAEKAISKQIPSFIPYQNSGLDWLKVGGITVRVADGSETGE